MMYLNFGKCIRDSPLNELKLDLTFCFTFVKVLSTIENNVQCKKLYAPCITGVPITHHEDNMGTAYRVVVEDIEVCIRRPVLFTQLTA